MKQANLPDELLFQAIKDMGIGESGYTAPFCMMADMERRLWLYTLQSYSNVPSKVQTMKITRTVDGWMCDVSKCTGYTWETESRSRIGYDPVIELITK